MLDASIHGSWNRDGNDEAFLAHIARHHIDSRPVCAGIARCHCAAIVSIPSVAVMTFVVVLPCGFFNRVPSAAINEALSLIRNASRHTTCRSRRRRHVFRRGAFAGVALR